jgi:hypothetical protein
MRMAATTARCAHNVRPFEQFTQLELGMCAYLFVSRQAPVLATASTDSAEPTSPAAARQHPAWTDDASGKH